MGLDWNHLPKDPPRGSSNLSEETTQRVREQFPAKSEEWLEKVSFEIHGTVELMYECWLKSKLSKAV